ncbi:hypothetical protein OUZ56_026580 [Daphnia magna]|uniref:Uncharacterized protein n=1 Tax=Daphnia magna TaxID=35525 RepID=A0ABQ9ZNJ5_9CRUS|nr:hypothetical protein OUZ56_026580 [Daphnia magna]
MSATQIESTVPAISYKPEDYASKLVPAGGVFCRQIPPRTTISYWYEMVENVGTRYFWYEMSRYRVLLVASLRLQPNQQRQGCNIGIDFDADSDFDFDELRFASAVHPRFKFRGCQMVFLQKKKLMA